MDRRKFVVGLGSLAAGGAAAMGTGAFTSVEANRAMTINTRYNGDALLGISPSDNSDNADAYVEGGSVPGGYQNAQSIDLGDSNGDPVGNNGAYGVNADAVTIIRDLLDIRNQGSQTVYVYIEGVPDKVSFFHDDSSFPKAEDGGEYTGNLNEPGTGRFQPDDPDASDTGPSDPNRYFKLPDLDPGDSLENIGLSVNTTGGNVNFNSDITIVAGTLDELES